MVLSAINYFFTSFVAKISFYAWIVFLLALLAAGFVPFFINDGVQSMTIAMGSAGFFTAMIYSLRVAVLAAVISFLLALFLILAMPRQRWIVAMTRGFCFFWLAVPPIAMLVGMEGFYDIASSFAVWLNPFPNINGTHHVIALVQKELPFLLLVMLNARHHLDIAYRRHATSIGIGGVAQFLKIEFPLLWQKLQLPCLLTLLFALNNVESGIFMGPSAPPSFPLLLLNSMQTQFALQHNLLHGFALWLLLLNGLLAVAFLLVVRGVKAIKKYWLRMNFTMQKINFVYYIGFAIAAIHGGLLVLAVGLLAVQAWQRGVANFFSNSFANLAEGFFNSLALALLASVSAVFLFLWWRFNNAMTNNIGSRATATKLRLPNIFKIFKYLLLLPLFLPDIILALHGKIISFLLSSSGFVIENMQAIQLVMLFFIHGGIGLGLALLMLDGAYEKMPPAMLRHGRAIGLQPFAIFYRLIIPLLWRPLLFTIALCFAVSLSLYTPNLMLAGSHDTMTTLLVAYQFSGDSALLAMASLWLLLLPMLGYCLAYGFSNHYDRKFH